MSTSPISQLTSRSQTHVGRHRAPRPPMVDRSRRRIALEVIGIYLAMALLALMLLVPYATVVVLLVVSMVVGIGGSVLLAMGHGWITPRGPRQ